MNSSQRRLFVLDTNVLMHDPTAMFRFEEHDVYLPMVVLEEVDANKKGMSEAARNVRQASRFLDDMMRGATKEQIDAGLQVPSALNDHKGKLPPSGRLFFQTSTLGSGLPDSLPGHLADNLILGQTLALQRQEPSARVVLVSKDINLRIKAAVVGVHAEDYYSDRTLEDADILHTGTERLPADFWEQHGQAMRSWKEGGRTWYELRGPAVAGWHVNEFVHEDSPQGIEAMVRSIDNGVARLELDRWPMSAVQTSYGPSSPLHICRTICRVSSSRSKRSASGGNGTPRPRCSRSYHAAPIPSIARPPDRTSRVVTTFARSPGYRYVTPVTRACSSTVLLWAARKPKVVYASSIGAGASPRPAPSIWK